jgi:hypothetical protein
MKKSDPLIEALTSVEANGTALKLFSEKVERALRAEIRSSEVINSIRSQSDWHSLKSELDNLVCLMNDYQNRLNSNLEARGRLMTLLNEAIVQQEQAILTISERLKTCQNTLELIQRLQAQLQEIPLQSLPSSNENIPMTTSSAAATHKRPLDSDNVIIHQSDAKRHHKTENSPSLTSSDSPEKLKNSTNIQATSSSELPSIPPLKSRQPSTEVKPDIPEATMDDEDAVREEQIPLSTNFTQPPHPSSNFPSSNAIHPSSTAAVVVSHGSGTSGGGSSSSSSSQPNSQPAPMMMMLSSQSSGSEDYNPDVFIDEFYNEEEHVENESEVRQLKSENRNSSSVALTTTTSHHSNSYLFPSQSLNTSNQYSTTTNNPTTAAPIPLQTGGGGSSGGMLEPLNPFAQLLSNPNFLALIHHQNILQTLQHLTSPQSPVIPNLLSSVSPSPPPPPSTPLTSNGGNSHNNLTPLTMALNPSTDQNQQFSSFAP